MTDTFVKHDNGKPRCDLLPPGPLLAVSRVLTSGAAKYGEDNWHACADPRRYVAALLRHVFAFMAGEVRDPETGEHHMAHAATCALFVVGLEERAAASAPAPKPHRHAWTQDGSGLHRCATCDEMTHPKSAEKVTEPEPASGQHEWRPALYAGVPNGYRCARCNAWTPNSALYPTVCIP